MLLIVIYVFKYSNNDFIIINVTCVVYESRRSTSREDELVSATRVLHRRGEGEYEGVCEG